MSEYWDRMGADVVKGCVGAAAFLGLAAMAVNGFGEKLPDASPATAVRQPDNVNDQTRDADQPQPAPSARSVAPDSSDAKSPQVAAAENMVKLIINLNHRLCAEIVNVQPGDNGIYHVTCVKNIGGKATIDYLLNASTNDVVRI